MEVFIGILGLVIGVILFMFEFFIDHFEVLVILGMFIISFILIYIASIAEKLLGQSYL